MRWQGHVGRAGLLCLLVPLMLAGCSSAPGPTNGEIDAGTLPAAEAPPNEHSDTGGCALITPEQVEAATGVAIDSTSSIGLGCAWIASPDSGGELVATLRQIGGEDGNGARAFTQMLATQEGNAPVQQVPGLGTQAFSTESSAPTIWWQQNQRLYSVAIQIAPAGDVGLDEAAQLATIASGNLPG